MKKWFCVITFVAVCTIVILLSAKSKAESGRHFLRGFGSRLPNGKELWANVSEDDIKDTPTWKPSQENLPLDIKSALSAADKAFAKLVQDSAGWCIEDITLVHFGKYSLHAEQNDKWMYVIQYQICGEKAGCVAIPVLFDGRVIEPKEGKPE